MLRGAAWNGETAPPPLLRGADGANGLAVRTEGGAVGRATGVGRSIGVVETVERLAAGNAPREVVLEGNGPPALPGAGFNPVTPGIPAFA